MCYSKIPHCLFCSFQMLMNAPTNLITATRMLRVLIVQDRSHAFAIQDTAEMEPTALVCSVCLEEAVLICIINSLIANGLDNKNGIWHDSKFFHLSSFSALLKYAKES